MNQRAITILSFLFVAVAAGCSDTPPAADLVFTSISGLVEEAGPPAYDEVLVIDGGQSALVPVTTFGALAATTPIEPPPGGWPNAAAQGWRVSESVVIAVPAEGGGLVTNVVDPVSGAGIGWVTRPTASTVIVIDGFPAFVSGTSATSVRGQWALPASDAVFPGQVTAAGFPWLSTDNVLGWWDPVSGTNTWSVPVTGAGRLLAWSSPNLAWVQSGQLVTAAITVTGPGTRYRIPLEASPARLKYDPIDPNILWVSGTNGVLSRVVGSATPGILCQIDNNDSGSRVDGLAFVDEGRLSNASLAVVRRDRSDCPGWTLNDSWTVKFAGVPDAWTDLSVTSGTTLADLPFGNRITTGDRLVADEATYQVTSIAPLAWSPVLPTNTAGDLVPVGRWTVQSVRGGFVGTVLPGARFESPGLEFTISVGSDPADPGDIYSFETVNGATGFSTTIMFSNWQRSAEKRVIGIDRKAGTVRILDPTVNQELLTVR